MGRRRRRSKRADGSEALGFLLLVFIAGLFTGQAWAWVVLVVFALGVALVVAMSVSQPAPAPKGKRRGMVSSAVPPSRLLAPGQQNPWAALGDRCRNGNADEIAAAIRNLEPYFDEARPGLSAPDWRMVGEGYERVGAREAAIDAYRRALAINEKIGVKRKLQQLEKEGAET